MPTLFLSFCIDLRLQKVKVERLKFRNPSYLPISIFRFLTLSFRTGVREKGGGGKQRIIGDKENSRLTQAGHETELLFGACPLI